MCHCSHLHRAFREEIDEVVGDAGDAGDLGLTVHDRPEPHPETLGQLGAQHRLIQATRARWKPFNVRASSAIHRPSPVWTLEEMTTWECSWGSSSRDVDCRNTWGRGRPTSTRAPRCAAARRARRVGTRSPTGDPWLPRGIGRHRPRSRRRRPSPSPAWRRCAAARHVPRASVR